MEYSKLPSEYEPLPQEHRIPEEFPAQKKITPVPKKKSTGKRLAMLAISGVVTLHLSLGFLFPDLSNQAMTDEEAEHREEILAEMGYPSEPVIPVTKPVETVPQTPTLPQANPNLELSLFEDGFIRAGKEFAAGSYVTAAQTLAETYALNYSVGNGKFMVGSFIAVSDDAISVMEKDASWNGSQVVISCYYDTYYMEGKDTLDPYSCIVLTMMKEGADHQTELLTVSFPEYALGDKLVQTDASYLTGMFDASGSCDQAMLYHFGFFPEYAGEEPVITGYTMYSNKVVSGPVKNGHFSGLVYARHWGIGYDGNTGAFTAETVSPENDCNVWGVYELNEQGVLDWAQLDYLDLRSDTLNFMEAERQALQDPNVRYYLTGDEEYQFFYVKSTAAPELQYHYRWCYMTDMLYYEMFPLYRILDQYQVLSATK